MPTRNINLTEHFDHFVERQVSSGRYSNASEIVREALRLLEEQDQERQAKLKALRASRSNDEVRRTLDTLRRAAGQEPKAGANGNISPANTMPYIVDAVRAYATVGEICEALRDVYGTYTEVSIT